MPIAWTNMPIAWTNMPIGGEIIVQLTVIIRGTKWRVIV